MSWLYSQALVEAYSADTCSDGAPSVQSNGNPIPQAYCASDKMTAFSRLSRFGMTFAALTDDLGAELLTWFQADSRARTSAPPEKAPESSASEAGYGEKWHELSVRYDRDTSSWKTHRCLWEEDLPWSSVILPKWGSIRDGVCSARMKLAHRIGGNDAGLWATPTTMDKLPPKSAAALNREATIARPGRSKPGNLRDQVSNAHMWPTPKANDAEKRGNFDLTNPRNGLPAAVKQWPTPTARDCKSGLFSPEAKTKRDAHSRGKPLNEQIGGQLNPTWVEWLMGWPLGWTDLKPLATDKCRNAQPALGEFSQ